MGAKKPLIKVGDKFSDFSATDITGKRWTNADIEGKITVLNLWFTGCGPCRAEMPELSTWKDEMSDVMFSHPLMKRQKSPAKFLIKLISIGLLLLMTPNLRSISVVMVIL